VPFSLKFLKCGSRGWLSGAAGQQAKEEEGQELRKQAAATGLFADRNHECSLSIKATEGVLRYFDP
jgi:hypothetical protein